MLVTNPSTPFEMQTFQVILLVVLAVGAALAFPGYDHYAYPRYDFEYGVHSAHTGDFKNQWQYRDGSVVKNAYNLKEHDRAISRQDVIADGGHYNGGLAYGRYAGGYYGGASSYANLGGHYGGLFYSAH